MAISEVKMRKNELEDITNTNKSYNKKLNLKKVTKKEHRHNKSVSFENYLLTPKDEDYYYNDDESSTKQFDFETSSKVDDMKEVAMNSIPSPDTMVDDNESEVDSNLISEINDKRNFKLTDDCQDLSKNPDYIVLTSSLRLLKANKDKISNEIVELSNLLEFFNNCENPEEITKFFSKLLNNKLNLPKQNKILKSPVIKISKYQSADLKLADTNNDKPLFKTLNLFNNN